MAKLKPGSVTVDLETGGVYGDLEHCPREDLLESAEVLLSLLPKVQHKGLWGLAKAYDADCYLYTSARKYELPWDIKDMPKGVKLEAEIHRAEDGQPLSRRPFKLIVMAGSDRERYWRFQWHSHLVGSVREGQVSPETEGMVDLTAEARARQEQERAEAQRREASKPKQTQMVL